MTLYSYKHPDGGWRQVELLFRPMLHTMSRHAGQSLVRDWHRGDVFWVPSSTSPNEFYQVKKYEGPQP